MRERPGIGFSWLIGSAGKRAVRRAGRKPEVGERRLRRAPRATAATLLRSRGRAGAGRDGGPGSGLAGERGWTWAAVGTQAAAR